jgi:hypothetical protein
MENLRKHKIDEIESIKVFLDENTTPIAFAKKKAELIDAGMSEEEVNSYLRKTPFEMEIYYSINQGLFMVESETVTDCDIVNPYNGEMLEEAED